MSRTMQDLFSVSSGKSTNGSARSTCDTGTLSCRIVHVLAEVTCPPACITHPATVGIVK